MADNGSESRTLLTLVGLGVVVLALIAGIVLDVVQTPASRRFLCTQTGAFCSRAILAQLKSAMVEIASPASSAT